MLTKPYQEFLTANDKKNKKAVIYFHNGGKYDVWQILNDICNYENYDINFIKNGGRILSCRISQKGFNGEKLDFQPEIELRDSYALFAEKLADFKKQLNLNLNLEKEI